MADNTSTNVATYLTRTNIWSTEIKDILKSEMMAQRFVRVLTELPDGTTLNIPSLGQSTVRDYVAGQELEYDPMSTGNFTFTIDKYIQTGHTLRKDQQEDSFYAEQLLSQYRQEMEYAIFANFEQRTFEAAESGISANSREKIDGFPHRWSGGNAGLITLEDFAAAKYALDESKVPDIGRVAIVDPAVEFAVNNLSQVTTNDNPAFEGIVTSGFRTGMRFIRNIYGFDVYVSNFLPTATDSALQEATAATKNDFSTTTGKVNLFFSTFEAPFVGAWRRMPELEYEYEMDRQIHKWAMTARYGVKLWRPENMVRVITKSTVFATDA